jgi:hypothetical protein
MNWIYEYEVDILDYWSDNESEIPYDDSVDCRDIVKLECNYSFDDDYVVIDEINIKGGQNLTEVETYLTKRLIDEIINSGDTGCYNSDYNRLCIKIQNELESDYYEAVAEYTYSEK